MPLPQGEIVLGEYSSESSIVETGFTLAQYEASLAYARSLPPIDYSDVASGRNLTRNIDLSQILPVLTYSHEINHFNALFSTPFGLYIWRISQAIVVDVQYLCFLRRLGVLSEPPLRENIRARCALFHKKASALTRFEDLWRLWEIPRSEKYADFLCWEIELLFRHLVHLMGSRQVTRVDFHKSAVICDVLLQQRSETPVRRFIKPPAGDPDAPLVSNGQLGPIAIIEMLAVTKELAVLSRLGANPASIAAWQSSVSHGVYGQALRFADRHLGLASDLMIMFGDVAIGGPVDIACPAGWVDFDEWYPTGRIELLTEHFRQNYVKPKDLLTALPFRHDFLSGFSALQSGPLWGEGFIRMRALKQGTPVTDQRSRDGSVPLGWYESEFRRFFALKAKGDLAAVYNATTPGFAPPVVLFADRADFARVEKPERSDVDLVLHILNLTLSHKFTRAILTNGKLSAKWSERSLFQQLMPGNEGSEDSEGAAQPTGREIVAEIYGEEMCARYT